MDLSLTREQILIRELASDVSKNICEPEADQVDKTGIFPMETWKKLAQIGLLKLNHDTAYGGTGPDPIAEMLVIEELSKASLTHGASYALLAHGFPTFLEKFGTEEQKQYYIPRILEGQALGAFCLTEPGAGSDASGVRTSSVRISGGYRLNGLKQFVTAGNISDYLLVVAKADHLAGEKGFTGFILHRDQPGIRIGRLEEKMGIRGLPTSEIILTDVEVPDAQILGGSDGVGRMMKFALATLDMARIGTGAQALGVAVSAYEHALKYSGERVQFGKPIQANQGIQWYLAEMATKLDIARMMIWRAAWMAGTGARVSKEAAMAKLTASALGKEVVDKALQIYGGYGYMRDYPLERMYRDIRITEIYEGSSEIMKMVIASSILPKRK